MYVSIYWNPWNHKFVQKTQSIEANRYEKVVWLALQCVKPPVKLLFSATISVENHTISNSRLRDNLEVACLFHKRFI